jgi:hypothetical protein
MGSPAVSLEGHPDGHFSLRIVRSDGYVVDEKEFQSVRFVGNGKFELAIQWLNDNSEIFIQGKKLDIYKSGVPPLEIELTKVQPTMELKDFDDTAIETACRTWIANRRKKFSVPSLRPGRKPKTLTEQAKDLRISIDNTKVLSNLIDKGGQTNLIGYLAAELRALVYWTKDDTREGGYNPLLLRLASKDDLPLPVIYQREQKLMDFQEFAKKTVLQLGPAGVHGGIATSYSLLDIISETANTLGVSHYDEDISNAVNATRNIVFLHLDTLARTLCQASIRVAELGESVLERLAEKGLIDPAQLAERKPC